MNNWGNIRAILFDAVGTLIEADPPVAAAYAEAAHRQAIDLDPAVIKVRFRRHFGDDEVDELRGPMATDEARERRRWRRIVAHVLPELPDPERAFGELWEQFGSPSAWRTFPDVIPALEALRTAGLRIRIGSNFDARLRAVVRGLPGLAQWSDSLIISSEVGYRKPHPEFYRAACAALALPPEQILVVGDDLENDVLGARRFGLTSLLVDRDGRAPDDLPHAPDLMAIARRLLTPGTSGRGGVTGSDG